MGSSSGTILLFLQNVKCFKALSLGIFPYVLKLLTSQVHELREVLVFIWAKIFALERVGMLFLKVDFSVLSSRRDKRDTAYVFHQRSDNLLCSPTATSYVRFHFEWYWYRIANLL